MPIEIIGKASHLRSYGYGYREVSHNVGLCECGHQVSLQEFTNTCVCGRDYNMSGELLAPRSQWGEETGETAEEILRAGHHQE